MNEIENKEWHDLLAAYCGSFTFENYRALKDWITQAKEQWEQAAREEGRIEMIRMRGLEAGIEQSIIRAKSEAYASAIETVKGIINFHYDPDGDSHAQEIADEIIKSLTDKPTLHA